jgi:hypothetical protein
MAAVARRRSAKSNPPAEPSVTFRYRALQDVPSLGLAAGEEREYRVTASFEGVPHHELEHELNAGAITMIGGQVDPQQALALVRAIRAQFPAERGV